MANKDTQSEVRATMRNEVPYTRGRKNSATLIRDGAKKPGLGHCEPTVLLP